MSVFVDPTGEPTFGIGICARCARVFPLAQLLSDPNAPGLMVCKDDQDVLDPYRLPARTEDQIVLPFARPDEAIIVSDVVTPPIPPPVTVDDTVWAASFWADNFWAANFWANT